MEKPTYLEMLAKYGVSSAHPGGMGLTIELLKKLNIDSDTAILDVGCGAGQTSAFIAKKYMCKVTAIDINEEMLKKSSIRFENEKLNINLLKADASKLPFESQSFDILLSESVTAFTDTCTTLGEYYRVLKQPGTLVAIEITAKAKLTSYDISKIKSVYNIDRLLSKDEWITSFMQAGFTDIKTFSVAARPTSRITSIKMLRDFSPHLNTLIYSRRKLGYRVFLCKK